MASLVAGGVTQESEVRVRYHLVPAWEHETAFETITHHWH